MITLTTRTEIVTTKKIIGSELAKMQQAYHDEDILQYYKDTNEAHVYWEQYDCISKPAIDYTTFSKVISLGHSDIDTFTINLTEKLTELFQTINATRFILIAHLKRDFFGNTTNKFKPLKNAYKLLEQIVGNKTFKGAFIFDLNNLPDFINILFWIGRCDPSLPDYLFLFDEQEQVQFDLCKYGNLHLTEFNREQLSKQKLRSMGWTVIEGQEFDNFTEDGVIKGRQIKV